MMSTLFTDHLENSQVSLTSYNRLIAVLLVFFALSLSCHSALGQTTDWNTLSTGSHPVSIISTDVDGTLGTDLLVVDQIPSGFFTEACPQCGGNSSTVTVFSGLGDGSFATVSETRLGRTFQANIAASKGGFSYHIDDYSVARPRSSVIGDFDGDGTRDLLVIEKGLPYILMLTGPRLNTVRYLNWPRFEQSMNLADLQFESDATSIAAADFDRDGKLDIILTKEGSESEDTLSVYHNEGGGNFSKSVGWPITTSGSYPYYSTIDDVDGDGNKDIIVAMGGYLAVNVIVINGNGDGTFRFSQQSKYFVGHTAKCVNVATGDFNNDGKNDLVVAAAEQLLFLAGTGEENNLFQAKKVIDFWNAPEDLDLPIGIVAEDFNHDHNLDFAIADPNNDCVRVYLGNGDESFTEGKQLLVGEGWQPVVVATDDINGNMYPDLVIGGNGKSAICILLNYEGTGFNKVRWPQVGTGVTSVTLGDFNNDKNVDLATSRLLPANPGPTLVSTTEKAIIGGQEYSAGDALFYGSLLDGASEVNLFLASFSDDQKVFSNTEISLGVEQAFPRDILARDLNGDGSDDLVVATYGANYILVNLSVRQTNTQGMPEFAGWQKYYVGWYPISLLVGNWNGDQHSDLAVVNFDSDNISILLNNGDGSFREAQRVQVERKPKAAIVEDMNSDGKQDLVVTYEHASNVSLLVGKGDGTFEPQRVCNVGCPDCELLASGDFDKKNGPDLVVGTVSGNILILINNGDGTFKVGTKYSTSGDLRSLATVYYDDDGNLDLLVASCSGGLQLWRGMGDGTLAEGDPIKGGINITGNSTDIVHPSSIAVSDNLVVIATEFPSERTVNVPVADGKTDGRITFPEDIVIVSETSSGPPRPPTPISQQVLDIAVGDFNTDSVPDLAVLMRTKDAAMKILTMLGPGVPSQSAVATFEVDMDNAASFLEVGDMDGDSLLDIVAANTAMNTVSLLWGQGNGTFRPGDHSLETVVAPAVMERLGDWGLVVSSMKIDVFIPKPSDSRTFYKVSLNIDDHIAAIATGDLNIDNYPDLVVVGIYNQKIQVFSGEDIIKATGDPDQAVKPVSSLWINGQPSAVCVGLFDADQYCDLAVALVDRDEVQILHGTGDFKFTWGNTVVVGRAPVAMKSGHINNDFNEDLIIANAESRDLSLLLGTEDGDFPAAYQSTVRLTSNPKNLAITDLNMDGRNDIAVVYKDTSYLTLLYNTTGPTRTLEIGGITIEQRTFKPPWFPSGQTSAVAPLLEPEHDTAETSATRNTEFIYQGRKDVETASMNNDNIPDIVLTSQDTNTVSILLGSGTHDQPFLGSYTTILDVPLEGPPAIGDFDGDRQTDIAIISPSSNNLIILWGNGRGGVPTKSIIPTGVVPIAVISVDLNKDNIDDLAVLCQGTSEILLYISKAERTVEFEITSLKLSGTPGAFVVADVNNDGLSDFVVSDFLGGEMTLFLASAAEGGTLVFSLDSQGIPPGTTANTMLAADLDNDRAVDLVIFEPENEMGLILYNTAYGQFSEGSSQLIGCNPVDALFSDLNQDRYLDLIITEESSGVLLIYRNLGDGTFTEKPTVYLGCQNPYSIASGNFDLDKNPDLVVTDRSGGIWVLWGKGDDTLLEKEATEVRIE